MNNWIIVYFEKECLNIENAGVGKGQYGKDLNQSCNTQECLRKWSNIIDICCNFVLCLDNS